MENLSHQSRPIHRFLHFLFAKEVNMNGKALCILALVAAAMVATEAAYCHTSAYKVPANTAVNNKKSMFKACFDAKKIAAMPLISKVMTMPDGCTVLIQTVASEAAWKAYSNCEKNKAGVDNKKFYAPLDAQSDPCDIHKTTYPSKVC